MLYKPLRIRAYMQTPVISDKHLPLDGLIYYQAVREKMGSQLITKPNESNVREEQGIRLPFMYVDKGEQWFYQCSFAQWPECAIEKSSFKVKKGDWLQHGSFLSDKTKKIDIARGKYKAYHITYYYRYAPYIDWYCNGDVDELRKLLNFCTGIGKNIGEGWGAVKNWEISDWPENWSIRGYQNKLMRAVPMLGNNGFLYGVRPSYWNPRHQFNCKMPD
jgi:CRISPR type IV-associated protein Csf3